MRHHLTGFIESMRAKCYSPDTLEGRGKSIGYFLTYAEENGVKKIGAVKRELILGYMLHLRTEKRLKNGSIQTLFSDLKNFFLHLEKNGELIRNPCDGINRPKDEDRLPAAVLTPSEVEKILATPPADHPVGIRDRAVLELLYSTGLRRAELTALMVSDLDLKGGLAHVTKGKGGRGRLVPLGERACTALERYLPIRHHWARRGKTLTDALSDSQTPECVRHPERYKKLENFKAAVALHYGYYNFVKTHTTIRCTPAMEAGVTNSPWTVSNLVEMIEG